MPKKKILHLITGLEIGGTEIMLLKTLPYLQSNFDNHVCCITGQGPIGKQLQESGVEVSYLNLKNILDISIIWRFRKIIREFQPDILVTYLIHADLFGRIFGRIFRIKKIICNQRGKLLQWEFLRIIDWSTKFLVTKYIVQTKTARQELMKTLRLPKEKFEIIPNLINIKEFDFDRERDTKRESLDLNPADIVITCVSKLRRGKGHEYLLKAFEELYAHHSNIRLLIVGDGEQKEKLLEQIEYYQSKSAISFLGNRDDVKEILSISDIFVLPTLGEGMSNALMEAMSTGIPVITTDLPENRELITNGETGILIPTKDPSAIIKAIEGIINDEEQRSILRRNAKKSILENFDSEVIIDRLKKFYFSL